jgi:hypothetical protein
VPKFLISIFYNKIAYLIFISLILTRIFDLKTAEYNLFYNTFKTNNSTFC